MSIENLQNLLEESVGLIEDLTQANAELDIANAGLNKDRTNLGDADVYEIVEKKQADVAKCEAEIQATIKPQIAELEELFKHTKSATAPLVQAFKKIKDQVPTIESSLAKAKGLANEINKLISSKDLYGADLPFLTEIIKKLRELAALIQQLQKEIAEIK